jgi:hypothetical protein
MQFTCRNAKNQETINLEKSVERGFIVQDTGFTVLW